MHRLLPKILFCNICSPTVPAFLQDFRVLSTCFTVRVFPAALLHALASLVITEIIPLGEKQEGGWHFTFLWDCNCPIECPSAGCALLHPVWFTPFVQHFKVGLTSPDGQPTGPTVWYFWLPNGCVSMTVVWSPSEFKGYGVSYAIIYAASMRSSI